MGVSNKCGDGDQLSAICYQKGCFEKKKVSVVFYVTKTSVVKTAEATLCVE